MKLIEYIKKEIEDQIRFGWEHGTKELTNFYNVFSQNMLKNRKPNFLEESEDVEND